MKKLIKLGVATILLGFASVVSISPTIAQAGGSASNYALVQHFCPCGGMASMCMTSIGNSCGISAQTSCECDTGGGPGGPAEQ